VPVAAIATTVFAKEAKNSANILRMPDFQTVEITHPLSTLTQDQIRQRAYEAVLFIVPIITGKEADKNIRYEIDETSEKTVNLNSGHHSLSSNKIESVQEIASCADG
jgi:hypothetical protein